VQCLVDLKLLEVVHTTDGKEYLTPNELAKEIREELTVRGGVKDHYRAQRLEQCTLVMFFKIFILPSVTPGMYLAVPFYQPGKKNGQIFYPGGKKDRLGMCLGYPGLCTFINMECTNCA